jgi:hypothetical protein
MAKEWVHMSKDIRASPLHETARRHLSPGLGKNSADAPLSFVDLNARKIKAKDQRLCILFYALFCI